MAHVGQKFTFGAAGSLGSFLPRLHLRLGPFALGDIAGVALDTHRFPVLVNHTGAYLQRNALAASGHNFQFVGLRAALCVLTSKYPAGPFQVLGCNDVRQIRFESLIARVAGDEFAGPVKRGKIAGEVVRINHVTGVLEQVSVTLLESDLTL